MTPSAECILEMKRLGILANDFLARGNRGKYDELWKKADLLGQGGLSTRELEALLLKGEKEYDARAYREKYERYLAGKIEYRDFLAGQQTISYTQLVSGGALVPDETMDEVFEAMAEVSPMTDAEVVNFSMSGSPFQLQPAQSSGYDNSSIAAQIIGEGGFQAAQVIPPVAGKPLRSDITFRVALGASLEAEMDIPDLATKITRSISVGLSRKIGTSVLQGKGGTDILGVTNSLGPASQNNGTAGKIVLTDINNWFFSIDHYYRRQKRCCWLFNDAGYKLLRNATDSSGRPLLSVKDDEEELMGKKVFICPDLSVGTSIGVGAALYGDMSHLIVRASKPAIQRAVEQANTGIEKGEAQYIGRMRADATIFDASQGSKPPIVLISIN